MYFCVNVLIKVVEITVKVKTQIQDKKAEGKTSVKTMEPEEAEIMGLKRGMFPRSGNPRNSS